MQTTTNKRSYTPQFSNLATVSVRRLAWAINKPMTSTVDIIIRFLPTVVDPSKVCLACQDKSKCSCCIFGSLGNQQDTEALKAGL